ncbi:MAG TPA: pilus assembly protein N-terminal domain-containing protein [Terriglobales bacterium]|nr:pilus assembly protein N-terminal domain-containing protein [Terriglobales bacterium]
MIRTLAVTALLAAVLGICISTPVSATAQTAAEQGVATAAAQQNTVGSAGQAQPAGSVPAPTSEAGSNPPADAEVQMGEGTGEAQQQTLHLLVGRSLVITSPGKIKRISVAEPTIADAIVISPFQLLVNGKKPGGVSLVLWNESGQSQTFELLVDLDILGLAQKIREVFPEESVKVEASKDAVMLSGPVTSAAVAEKILEVAKTASPKVVDLLKVPTVTTGQVLLQVKFAEVDRGALSQYGINLFSLPGNKFIGTTSTQQFSPPQLQRNEPLTPTTGGFEVSDLLNIFVFRPDINLAATIKALQNKNLLQILAEPNLLTQTGKEASFLAGGEFPFPIVQNTGGVSAVTIQFKEFGVRLSFTPTISAEGVVHLKVKPEVSSLDFANALNVQGFTIPALSTRRVESEMDLRDGQTFAIAGLVDNRVIEQFNKVPGIGDIPVLGKLFQSRTFNRTRNELMVVVTPKIVQPLEPGHEPQGPEFPKPFMPASAAPADKAAGK